MLQDEQNPKNESTEEDVDDNVMEEVDEQSDSEQKEKV